MSDRAASRPSTPGRAVNGRGVKRTVVAIGVFDGLHLGHRAILDRALELTRAPEGRCVVVSFDPHPDAVLARGPFHLPPPLTPLPEKRARLLALGVEMLDVIPFTRELAALEPEEFVDGHLVARHAPSALVVGQGFALGRGRSGDVPRLRTIGQTRGFEVHEVPTRLIGGEPVSSTRIRGLLAAGQVGVAAELLGRRYDLAGTVVRGDGIGRTLGFPTANLRLHEEKLLPADGVYAVRCRIGDSPTWQGGAMSIGVRPTFAGKSRALEVFLLDWEGDLVGGELAIEFVDWLRSQVQFDSVEALIEAIGRDVEATRRRLAATAT